MRQLDPFSDLAGAFVADASVWINLAATGRSRDLLRALGRPVLITDIVLAELERGRAKGRQTASDVAAHIESGLARIVQLPSRADDTFLSLVSGSTAETLDDGEAATLAYAVALGITATTDDGKALALSAKRFPEVMTCTTADLVLDAGVAAALGAESVAGCLFAALQGARMRVPSRLFADVVALIGAERACLCPSLPSAIRAGQSGQGGQRV
jgi:predicted nucleic acid-binding protein